MTSVQLIKKTFLKSTSCISAPELGNYDFTTLYDDLKSEGNDLLYPLITDSCSLAIDPINNYVIKEALKIETGAQMLQSLEVNNLKNLLRGINFFFQKGIIWNARLGLATYKRVGDIDIFFNKADINAAVKKLASIGYSVISANANGEFSMINANGHVLDVHYNLSASSPFNALTGLSMLKIMQEREMVEVFGCRIPTLNLEYTFIHACIHFAVNHRLHGFIHLFELITFLRIHKDRINHNRVSAEAKKLGLTLIIGLCLNVIFAFAPDLELALLAQYPIADKVSVKKFIEVNSILVNCIEPADKARILHVNAVSEFCADSWFKKIFIYLGNKMWEKRMYNYGLDI